MISAFKPGLRVKQEAGILTVTKLFARNCVILPGTAGCIRRRKSRTDVTYWGKWYGDGSETEEKSYWSEWGIKYEE